MWVHEQYTDVLFTEDRSKVAATVHVPYMNSAACWGKGVKKKKKKRRENVGNLKRSKHNVDPNALQITHLAPKIKNFRWTRGIKLYFNYRI